jgi:hypothetical protein
MSMITEFAALAGALVSSRAYPGTADETAATPYIVYSRVSSIPQNDLDAGGGAAQLMNTRMQANIYAPSYGAAQATASALKAALLAWSTQNTVELELDLYEPDTKLHHIVIDVSIWHQ